MDANHLLTARSETRSDGSHPAPIRHAPFYSIGVIMTKYRSTMPMLLGLCLAGSTLAAMPGSAALGPTGTVFDGDYAGAMNQTTPGVAGDGPNSDSACAPTRPATMLIRNGNVTLQYADWAG